MGGVGNGAAEEDWRWDLNPGAAAIPRRESQGFGEEGGERTTRLWQELGPRGFEVLPFAIWLRKQERLCLEGKG